MQTIDRTQEPAELEAPPERPHGRTFAVIAGVLVLALVVAGVAYAIGASQSDTRTIVKTAAPTPTSAPLNCVPGAAKGSCNTDEFIEQQIKDKPLRPATRALLAAQLVAARAAALKYPTVADAERAGMIVAGRFSPLTGAHYISISGATSGFDVNNPGSYIYDGTSPTSKIIGLMYLSSGEPQGFAGPNDHWHRHSNTCVIFNGGKIKVPFPADSNVRKSQCDRVGGVFMRRTTWMVHAWVVPGWESPSGVFSHDNHNVLCADGTAHADASGFCKGT